MIGLSSFGYSFNCVSGGDDEGSLAAEKILSANFNFLRRSFEYMLPFLKIFPSKERTELENAEKSFYGLINKVCYVVTLSFLDRYIFKVSCVRGTSANHATTGA